MDKKLLRKELLAVRQEIAATRPEAAKELARNIVGWLEANPQFSSVGLYYPIQSEPDLMEALGAVPQLVLNGTASLGVAGPIHMQPPGLSSIAAGHVHMIPVAAPGHPLAQGPNPPGAAAAP